MYPQKHIENVRVNKVRADTGNLTRATERECEFL